MTENKEIALRKQRVFEYLVVLHPTVKYAEEGGLSEIVVPPTTVCGNDIDHARMLANRAIPAEHMNHARAWRSLFVPFENRVIPWRAWVSSEHEAEIAAAASTPEWGASMNAAVNADIRGATGRFTNLSQEVAVAAERVSRASYFKPKGA